MVQPLTVSAPELLMPPPALAPLLSAMVQPLIVSVVWLRMPSPVGPAPWLIVRPLRTTGWLALTSNTRETRPPLIVSCPAPGPWIVRPMLMASSPLDRVMVWPSRLGAREQEPARLAVPSRLFTGFWYQA